MAEGVSFADPASCSLSEAVALGGECWLNRKATCVAIANSEAGSRLGQAACWRVRLGDGVEVLYSVLRDAVVGDGCVIGPYAQLRLAAELGADCRVATSWRSNRAHLAAGCKVNHLSYIGDTELGSGGQCGGRHAHRPTTDGVRKNRTVIGAAARTGANSVLSPRSSLGRM